MLRAGGVEVLHNSHHQLVTTMPPSPEDKLPGETKRSPLGLPPRVGDSDPQKTQMIWDNMSRSVHKAHSPHRPSYLGDVASNTTILPFYWDHLPSDFIKYLTQELFDSTMTAILEHERVINWCTEAVHLYSLWATGDGNCLLHAISLALWGVEDSGLKLRRLLHHVMKGEFAAHNEERWRRERNRFDTQHIPGSGFRYNTTEWSAEWNMVVALSSPEQRNHEEEGLPFECLEEFHIFIMANILRRPIIVLAEDMWRDCAGQSLQPLNFSGIYLPLAWQPKECNSQYPIILGYNQMHFSPLVCTAPEPDQECHSNDFLIPLIDKNFSPLRVHFLKEEEEDRAEQFLQEYLRIQKIQMFEGDDLIPFIQLSSDPPREEVNVFESYMKLANVRYRMYNEEQHNPENAEVLKAAGFMSARNMQQLNERVVHAGSREFDDHALGNTDAQESAAKQPSEAAGTSPATADDVVIRHPPPYSDSLDPYLKSLPEETQRRPLEMNSDPTATRLSCSTPECPYQRAKVSDEYCTSCYKAHTAVGKEAFKACLTESCLNSGERDYDGMCKVCYDQSKFMNDDIKAGRPASSPPVSKLACSFQALSARGPVLPEVHGRPNSPNVSLEGENPAAYNLSTAVINNFEVGSKKCRTPLCEFTGNPKFSGMCSKCYKRDSDARLAEGRYERISGDSLPKEISPSVGAKKKCVMPECEKTGHTEKNDLCSGCFAKQTKLLEKTKSTAPLKVQVRSAQSSRGETSSPTNFPESPSAERQRQLLIQAQAKLCSTPGCEMFGQPNQGGLCSLCYKKSMGVSNSVQKKSSRGKTEQGLPAKGSGSSLHFTVKKNMCATPGCNGVRITFGKGDLCLHHYREQEDRYHPQGHPNVSSKRAIPAAAPMPIGNPQPSAPPRSIYSNTFQSAYSVGLAGAAEQQRGGVEPATSVPTVRDEICAHPSCNNRTVPPLFVACADCIAFVKKVNNLEAAYNDVRQEGSRKKHQGISAPAFPEDELPMDYQSSDELPAENLMTFATSEKTSPALKDKFQYDHIKRVKCKAYGGCPNGMFGDPNYDNLCSKCFDLKMMKNYSSNTAPMNKTARQVLPPRSSTDIISGTATVPVSRSKMVAAPLPGNFQKCSTPSCMKQANPHVLEGYCNDCYPVYRPSVSTSDRKKKKASGNTSQHHAAAPSSSSSQKASYLSSSARQDLASRKTYPTETGGQAAMCCNIGCQNFGNSQSRGYCNACFLDLTKDKI